MIRFSSSSSLPTGVSDSLRSLFGGRGEISGSRI